MHSANTVTGDPATLGDYLSARRQMMCRENSVQTPEIYMRFQLLPILLRSREEVPQFGARHSNANATAASRIELPGRPFVHVVLAFINTGGGSTGTYRCGAR